LEPINWWPDRGKDGRGNPGVVGRFLRRQVPNVAESEASGKLVTKEAVILEIKAQGSKDVHTKEIKAYNQAENAARFPEAWEAFKAGYALEMDGRPLTDIPLLTGDMAVFISMAGVNTVEQLAAASDFVVAKLPNGRDLQKAAKLLLATAAEPYAPVVPTRRKRRAAEPYAPVVPTNEASE